jgi:hypothetical protein
MEPTYSILYLELQRQTVALAARDDHRLALAGAMASGREVTENSEDESGKNGEQSSTLDLSDMLVEAAREMWFRLVRFSAGRENQDRSPGSIVWSLGITRRRMVYLDMPVPGFPDLNRR